MNTTYSGQVITRFHGTDADGNHLNRQVLIYNGLLLLHFAVALAGYVAFWTMLLSMPVLVIRWMVSLHELFHLKKLEEVDPITRLMGLLFTPLSLGYREYQAFHWRHHQYMATPEDPEYYQIRGNPFIGFVNALTMPDQAYFRWLAYRGLDRSLIKDTLIRLALFTFTIGVSGWAFLWYWIPLRLIYGAGGFLFFYCMHRRGANYGVYPLDLSPWSSRLMAFLFGREVLFIACHHDIHHADSSIAARSLPEAKRYLRQPG